MVKHRIEKEDIGKLFKRTIPGFTKSVVAGVHYLRVEAVDTIDDYVPYYSCIIVRPGCDKVWARYCNLQSFVYEEVSNLEVLVVCGVKI